MAFVVEDGSGVADANSYAAVQLYKDYHTERGRDVTAQTDPQISSYLIRATDFVEKEFGVLYKGSRKTLTQSLGFPRTDVLIDGTTLSPSPAYSAVVAVGGSGYVVGNVVTVVGGTFTTAATFYVATVGGGGVVTSVRPVNRGDYSILPTNPVSVTGGSGSNLTLTVTFGVPIRFAQGVLEYAFRASKYSELAPDTPVAFTREDNAGDEVSAGGAVTGKKETVGPISEETTFSDPTSASTDWTMPRYPAADQLIIPFLRSGGQGSTIRN